MQVKICPEEARSLLIDYLQPFVENGVMDELFRNVVAELAPHAAAAARRAMRRTMATQDPEWLLGQLRILLAQLRETLDGIAMNPDMMAGSQQDFPAIVLASADINDWISYLDHRDQEATSEMPVPPAADVMMARGGLP